MSTDWKEQLEVAEQAYAQIFPELDSERFSQLSAERTVADDNPVLTKKGALASLSESSFGPPDLTLPSNPSPETQAKLTQLAEAEAKVAAVVRRLLRYRDQIVEFQNSKDNERSGLAALSEAINQLITEAGQRQLDCASIDVSGEAPRKNMPVREWKASLNARFTKVQRALVRLKKATEYLSGEHGGENTISFTDLATKITCKWSHHQTLQQKLTLANSNINSVVCSNYIRAVQQEGSEVIPEVYAFLACPSWQDNSLCIDGRRLSVSELVIPLKVCINTAALYGSLGTLQLCNCGISDEHAFTLASLLPQLHGLHTLGLRDNTITCTGASDLGKVLPVCTSLRYLLLDGNRISSRGAKHLHERWRSTRINQLSLSRNPLGDDGLLYCLVALLNPLRKAYPSFPPHPEADWIPPRLQISNTAYFAQQTTAPVSSGAQTGGRDLSKMCRQVLIRAMAVTRFVRILWRGPLTPTLNLEDVQINAMGAAMIAHVLKDNWSITALRLAHNAIGDEGAVSLANALLFAPNLQELDVGHNRIKERGIEALMRAASQSCTLESIDLSGNALSGTGLNWITSLGGSFYIDELVLSGNLAKAKRKAGTQRPRNENG